MLERPDSFRDFSNRLQLRFDRNENINIEYLSIIKRDLISLLEKDDGLISSYPNLGPAYQALGEVFNCEPELLYICTGSDSGIGLIFTTFVMESHKIPNVLITDPSFAMYKVYAENMRSQFSVFNLTRKKNKFFFDYQKFINQIEVQKPDIIFVPIIDSPSGFCHSREGIELIKQAAKLNNSLLVLDNAYWGFNDLKISSAEFRDNPNLVMINSCSKAIGLAGLRLGCIVNSGPLMRSVKLCRPMYEIGSLQAKCCEIIGDRISEIRHNVCQILEAKHWVEQRLREVQATVFETAGNFVVFAHDGAPNALKAFPESMRIFGPGPMEGLARVSIGSKEEMKLWWKMTGDYLESN